MMLHNDSDFTSIAKVKDHLQSRWWFPSQKAFKGIAFELIFFGIL